MLKKLLILFLILLISLLVLTWACNYAIIRYARTYIYEDVMALPYRKVALVLGASARAGDVDNPYFTYRMDKAAELYKQHKASYFILSGDNHLENYNEPKEMKAALINRGIPEVCLILDYAGFRTLDAVARCKKVFGQDSIIIVSQRFHNERALFLCKHFKVYAIAINAKDVTGKFGDDIIYREYLARVKAVLDCYVLHTQPHFYGKPVKIP